MLLDTRRNPVTPEDSLGQVRLFGGRLCYVQGITLSATLLGVAMKPVIVQIGHKIQEFRGCILTANAGHTLTDGKEIRAACVFYFNERINKIVRQVVERAEATTGAGGPITDAEILAAIPAIGAKDFTVAGQFGFARSGSAISTHIDNTARSFGVLEEWKATADGASQSFLPEGDATDGHYVPGPVIEVTTIATEWANADLLTDYPINFHGRLLRMVSITEVVIAGAGATVTVHPEIGSTAVTGCSLGSALADARGTVKSTAPTDPTDGIVKPGDVVSLVMASATAGSSGRVRWRLEFEILSE